MFILGNKGSTAAASCSQAFFRIALPRWASPVLNNAVGLKSVTL